jgi:aspartyl-tRNA(Asn)/glutamyl-tRNA(Gln) amidotransferase subunit C
MTPGLRNLGVMLLFKPDIIPSMVLSLEEVEHIAVLARLELTDDEKARYQEQLSAILDYAARLQALDTAEIPAPTGTRSSSAQTSSVLPAGSALRPDRPRPGLSLEDLLRNAPQAEQNQFRVPPVLE